MTDSAASRAHRSVRAAAAASARRRRAQQAQAQRGQPTQQLQPSVQPAAARKAVQITFPPNCTPGMHLPIRYDEVNYIVKVRRASHRVCFPSFVVFVCDMHPAAAPALAGRLPFPRLPPPPRGAVSCFIPAHPEAGRRRSPPWAPAARLPLRSSPSALVGLLPVVTGHCWELAWPGRV